MDDTIEPSSDNVKKKDLDVRARVARAIERVKLDKSLNNTGLAKFVGCSSDLIGLLLKQKRPASEMFLTAFISKCNLSEYYFTGESEELYSGGFKGWKTEIIVEIGKVFQDDHRETIQNVLYYIKSINEARAAKRQP